MAEPTVPEPRAANQLSILLDSPEVASLVAELEATRWTGRPGYPIRTMVGMALVKSLYVLPTWTRTVRLVAEHAALRDAIGGAPSVDACYRFTAKLRRSRPVLDACIASVLTSLHDELPEFRRARRHRRLRPSRLRQRPAVPLQGREVAGAVLRS